MIERVALEIVSATRNERYQAGARNGENLLSDSNQIEILQKEMQALK